MPEMCTVLHSTWTQACGPPSVLVCDPVGVELSFLDGTSISAGVLIGADGYFSQVRQQLLQDGPPSFGVSHSCATATQQGQGALGPRACRGPPTSALPACLMPAPWAQQGHSAVRELSERPLACPCAG